MENQKHFEAMAARWPSTIVAREEVKNFTGGAVAARYLANLDCAGKGPEGRFRVGRKICYPVAEVVKWLTERSEPVPKKTPKADPK